MIKPFNLIFTICIACILTASCTSCTNTIEPSITDSKSFNSYHDRKESHYFPVQVDTAKHHYYGGIKLTKYKHLNGAYSSSDIDGFTYTEFFPYIINKRNTQGGKPVEILYYDSTRSFINKRVEISALNPYYGLYDNVEAGYPSFEYYEKLDSTETEMGSNTHIDKYLTYYDAGWAQVNGYAYIIFSLVGVSENKILLWESTIVTLNKSGEVHAIINEPNETGPALVSEDGMKVVYKYGNYSENPYDDRPLGEIRIHSVSSKTTIKKIQPMDGGAIINLKHTYPDIVSIRYDNIDKRNKLYFIDYLDLSENIRYSKTLSNLELNQIREQFEFQYHFDIIDQIKVNVNNF